MTYSPPVRETWPKTLAASVAEAKVQWAVDRTDHDQFIQGLLLAAMFNIEGLINRVLITSTWRQSFASFEDQIRLGMGDVIAVDSVVYYDSANDEQTFDPASYGTTEDALGVSLALAGGQSWPSPYERADAVTVTWTAGYGPDPADVPPPLKQAVLLLAQSWYDEGAMGAEGTPRVVLRLIQPFIRMTV